MYATEAKMYMYMPMISIKWHSIRCRTNIHLVNNVYSLVIQQKGRFQVKICVFNE